MGGDGNVKLSTLYELDSTIHSFKGNMSTIKSDFDTTVKCFFDHFQKQRQVLYNRLLDAEKALEIAEMNLRILELRGPIFNNGQSNNLIKDHLIITGARNKVLQTRQERDRCKELLQRCDRIINNCSTRKGFYNGIYKIIEMSLANASKELGRHIANVIDYQNTNAGIRSNSYKEISPSVSEETFTEQYMNLTFYYKDGQPLKNARITIVDNEPFGFGQIDAITDDSGRTNLPYHDTSDCSIYIDGIEIYSGRLFKSMEYNKNNDGKVVHSDSEQL